MNKQLSKTTKKVFRTSIKIHFSKSEYTTKIVVSKLVETIKNKVQNKTPVLLMLSGGSSLQVAENLCRLFNDRTSDFKEYLTLSVVDERVVKGEDNNYTSLRKTSLGQCSENKKINWINTKVSDISEVEKVKKHALKFERQLRKWRAANPKGIIVALLGVGADGHTSGILPFKQNPSLDVENKKWVVGYDLNKYFADPDKISSHHYRSTTTAYFLINEVTYAFVYMVGKSKKFALEKIVSNKGSLIETPARLLRKRDKNTEIFTDQRIDF